MSLKKTMAETVADLRPFFNRKDISAVPLVNLLGKQRPTAMIGGMRLAPWDKRFETILVKLDVRNLNILRQLSFACHDNPIPLDELEAVFGPLTAEWNEKDQVTVLSNSNFEEEEAILNFESRIERYKMENAEGGLLLHQPDGSGTVLVPSSELVLPSFNFNFKEFERPPDGTKAKKSTNPLSNFLGGNR